MKIKKIRIRICLVIITIIIGLAMVKMIGIRKEFSNHLENKFSGKEFKIGFTMLNSKEITIESMIVTYEEDKGLYEGRFSKGDYDLTMYEIVKRLIKIK